MRESKRILSFLLAIVMLSSVFSVMASAKAEYKDTAIPASAYNDVDQPVFTLNQCSSMVLDYADKLLSEQKLEIDMSVLGKLNLSSVDSALNGIYGLLNSPAFDLAKGLLGSLAGLEKANLSTSRRSSTPAADADTNVIYSLFGFLNDNKAIISGAVDGSLDMGILSSFVDLSQINVNEMVRKMLYQTVYPNTKLEVTDPLYQTTPEKIPEELTADSMVQSIIDNLIVGTKVTVDGKDTYTGILDGLLYPLSGKLNIVSSTAVAYDFGEELLRSVYNFVLVPLLNTKFKVVVRKVCGVVYDPLNTDPLYTGDDTNLNEYALTLKINYTVPVHDFGGATLISDLNDILAEIIGAITNYTGWTPGDNTNALENLSKAVKYVLKLTGNKFFKDYIAIASDEDIDAMNYQQLFSYLVRSIVNSTVDYMNIPASADTLYKVAWYALKEALAHKVPGIDYSLQPKSLNGILYMAADLIVYAVNQSADMNTATAGVLPGAGLLEYSQGFDATLLSVVKWLETNYAGILNVSLSNTDAWFALQTLLTSIIPTNWINGFTNVQDFLKFRIIDDILMLDFTGDTGLFKLFDHVAGNDFSTKTVKKVLLETVARFMNLIFPDALKTTYTTFDEIILNSELKTIVQNVVGGLYTRKNAIIPVVLPLVTNLMGISVPEEYSNPSLLLPETLYKTTNFDIRNDSIGLNTGATNKTGVFTQDSLYNIKIVSINAVAAGSTLSINAVDNVALVNRLIPGGEAIPCTISGTFVQGRPLVMTMKYDVYKEDGLKLTTTPLVTRAFSYITSAVDDSKIVTKVDSDAGNYHAMSYLNSYFNQDADLASVADTITDLVSTKATLTRTPEESNTEASVVSRGSVTIDPVLAACGISAATFDNINTTKDGQSVQVPLYAARTSPVPTRPDDGTYQSNFVFSATKTNSSGGTETLTIPHKVTFYNDYGLPGLVSSEISAQRDPNNFSGGEAGQEWTDYMDALMGGVSCAYRPKQASDFYIFSGAFEEQYINLTAAVTALKATQVTAGVTALKTALDAIQAPNTKPDPLDPDKTIPLEYDDPNYSYLGLEDYVSYTYLRFSDERDTAQNLWSSQQLPSEPVLSAIPTPEQTAAHTQWQNDKNAILANQPPVEPTLPTVNPTTVQIAAHDQWQTDINVYNAIMNLKPIDVAYDLHRLNLYASRLVRVQAQKARLTEVLSPIQSLNITSAGYSPTSWAAFQKAYEFAVLVNNTSNTTKDGNGEYILRQTKVDTAREELIAAYKKLIQVADYTQLAAAIAAGITKVQDNYTEATWTPFAAALTAALAIPAEMSNSQANQTMIDNAAAALNTALTNLITVFILLPDQNNKPAGNNGLDDSLPVTIDYAKHYIYGLAEYTGAEGYVLPGTGYTLLFHDINGGFGTGSTVEVVPDGGGASIFYSVVIFGDLDGNGYIDTTDRDTLIDYLNYMIPAWNESGNSCYSFAGDLYHDGILDENDCGVILDYTNWLYGTNQTTGLVFVYS